MAGCPSQVFPRVSADAWLRIQGKARAAGYNVSGDAGSYSASGITLRWAYDAGGETLTLTCTARPFIVPCATINAKLRELIASSNG
jgi:hypothetical protein